MRSTLSRFQLPLRALLAAAVVAALLPIAAVLAWETRDSLRNDRNRTEDHLVRAAAGFAQSVDRELASSIDALSVLSQSELFQQGRIAAMGRLLHGPPRRDWDSVFVLDPQGAVVLDTAQKPSPPAAFRGVHQETMARLAPVVSGLADTGVVLAIPVMQQGQPRFVLGVRLSGSLWERLAAATELTAGAQARLYDRDGRLISQSGGISPAGARLPAEAVHAMARQPSGVQRSTEADGHEVYAAWDVVPLAGWHARVFVPTGPVDQAQRELLVHALSTSGAAVLAGLVLSGFIASSVARRLRRIETTARAHGDATARQDWRDEFVAMLTHELRNPLGAISAAADVLESTHPTSASAADARAVVSRQARRLSHMMHALLDASRAIAGRIELSRRPVDLGAMVRHVDETLALTGESREHPLVLELAPQLYVDADAHRLEQLLSHLLIHSAKCTPAGRELQVRTCLDGEWAVLQVRGARAEGRAVGSPGIEWTLAHALVELHGGTLVARAAAQTNEIVARLYAAAPPDRAAETRAQPPSRRRTVLVLQRDEGARLDLCRQLELEGHTVVLAENEADAMARMVELKPDVALVDLRPGAGPLQFARRARAAGYAGRMVALAPAQGAGVLQEARIAGFDDLVVEPVDPRRLRETFHER